MKHTKRILAVLMALFMLMNGVVFVHADYDDGMECPECGNYRWDDWVECYDCGMCIDCAADYICPSCGECTYCAGDRCDGCGACPDCGDIICSECESQCFNCADDSKFCITCDRCGECNGETVCPGCTETCGECGTYNQCDDDCLFCENCADICTECGDKCYNCADDVIGRISAIGTVIYSDSSALKISRARNDYNVLTNTQKALVTNYSVLTAAEAKYAQLQAAANQTATDKAAVENAVQKINAIGKVEYTSDCKVKIDEARNTYNALTATQKALVTNYAVLTEAEAKYAEMEALHEAIDAINAIGAVGFTTECKAKIDAARNAYNALSDAQKAQIPSNKGQRMMVIKGNGGEGKSQIGAVMTTLFGSNMKDGSIGKISENRFARADLEHILLCIDDDLRMEGLKHTNYVKSIVTAQGKMDLEKKNKQSYQGYMYARLLAFSNGDLQAMFDKSDGFFRRQLVLTTKDKNAERIDDPHIADKMREEIEGIFLWAFEGLQRLLSNNFQFTLRQAPERSDVVLHEAPGGQ